MYHGMERCALSRTHTHDRITRLRWSHGVGKRKRPPHSMAHPCGGDSMADSKQQQAQDDKRAEQEEQPREEGLLHLLRRELLPAARLIADRRRVELEAEHGGQEAEAGRARACLRAHRRERRLRRLRAAGLARLPTGRAGRGRPLAGRPRRQRFLGRRSLARVDARALPAAVHRYHAVGRDLRLADRAEGAVRLSAQLEPLVDARPAVQVPAHRDDGLGRGVEADVAIEEVARGRLAARRRSRMAREQDWESGGRRRRGRREQRCR
mmetsp:Transcript_51991/g.173521  ORF Transcript_51991/g.173521 Transcript_51991/m.173521 type:complete len:266 (+) Transcript_51991:72-869(+)